MDMSWLIVTEKDNAARRIASILFRDIKVLKRGVRYYYSPSYDAYVIGLKGHVIELDFPKELNNWRSTPLDELLKAKLVARVKERDVVSLLEELGRRVDRVTIATDYDREGELIGVEALEIIKRVNPNVKFDRVKFSAITKHDILKAFSNPTKIDFNLAKSALARQKIDLIWGAILTRLLSIHSGRLGRDFLSAGRVQTPTLRIIVEREKEIKEFKPKKYYEVLVVSNGFTAKHPKRFESREEAKALLVRIGRYGVVKDFKSVKREESKPIPFNTTEFLKEASRFMNPDKAMSIAENLYIEGYISYPRTDNTVYPKTLDLEAIVRSFLNSEFHREARLVLQNEIVPSRGKRETKDHPPIYPTAVAERYELSRDEWIIYELIVRRFLATLAPKALWEIRRAEIDCNGVRFLAGGKKLIRAGWRAIYIYSKAEESDFPILKVGETVEIIDRRIEEKKTKPPARYTSGSIIKVMERLNLGTKSTRHEILKKLIDRKYVYGNPLKPTQTAFTVIEVLKNIAETITLPDMTAKLEKEMDLIAEGKKSEREVVEESKKMLYEILKSIDYTKLAEKLKETREVIGRCPRCGGGIVLKRTKRSRFIGCENYPNCTFTIPLPQKGSIYVTSKVCEKHKMKEIKIRTKKGYWNIGCPYCNYLKWKNDHYC